MSETLSQEEIDKLLKAFSTGELDADDYTAEKEKEVKVYDFARPSKFSKEHLRTLENIFEHYGRLLYTNLPAYLRKNVQVDVMNAEALAYSEFSNALSNPVLLGIVNFAPLRGNVIMELGTNLGYAIIDRMLGGEGENSGGMNFSDTDRYLLVVASLPSHNSALRHINGNPDLRIIEMDGNYRVYVGTAPTITAARSIANDIVSQYPNVWVCKR